MNEKIKRFLNKYCEKHGISEEVALTHVTVQEYIKEITNETKDTK